MDGHWTKSIVELGQSLGKKSSRKRKNHHRKLAKLRPRLEQLEPRQLLAAATNLATISGTVFKDLNGNGGEVSEQVSGATVQLFRDDNGNGSLDAGDGQIGANQSTNQNGRYTFTGVTAGTFFVVQLQQSLGGVNLSRSVSPAIPVSPAQAAGEIVTRIDDFDDVSQTVSDSAGGQPAGSSSAANANVLGNERDIFVDRTSAVGTISIGVDTPNRPGLFTFDSNADGVGIYNISWDGDDNDARSLNRQGLGGFDLSVGGATGVQLEIGADAQASSVVNIYDQGGVSVSSFNLAIPRSVNAANEIVPEIQYIPFTSFSNFGNISNVGAIQLVINGVANINGRAELVGTVGPTNLTAPDFTNFEQADLQLTKTVDNASRSVGQTATFTVTLTNNSAATTATNVQVTDSVPTGITVTGTTVSGGTTFTQDTGIWSVPTLGPLATAQLQITGTINATGAILNSATITAADQSDPDPNNNTATATVTGEQIDIAVTKAILNNNTAPNVGDQVTFQITVTNNGPTNATGITVTENIPTGLGSVSGNAPPGTTFVGNTWTIPSLNVGASLSLPVTATVLTVGTKTNSASFVSADQPDSNENNNTASATITPAIADLVVAKAVEGGNLSPNVGENVTFNVSIRNDGPQAATNVSIQDVLPTGLTLVGSPFTSFDAVSRTGIWQIGNIAVGNTVVRSVTARVDTPGGKTNVAEVNVSDQFDDDNSNNRATAVITAPSVDLALTKTVNDATPNVGETVQFILSVRNLNNTNASGVVVQDILPVGVTFDPVLNPNLSFDGGTRTATWNVGDVPAGQTRSITISATANQTGLQTNAATITAADQFDPVTSNNTAAASLTPEQIDLAITKTVDTNRPNLNENVTFTVNVSNSGQSAATNVRVADRLPTGLTLVRGVPSAGNGTFNPTTRIWTIPSIPAGTTATLNVLTTVTAIAEFENIVEIIAADQTDVDSIPGNNPTGANDGEDDLARVSITTQQADLDLTKTVDNNNPNVGDTINFRVTVQNDGPDIATGVRVQDILPVGLSLAPTGATPSSGTFSGSTWILTDLGVNQIAELVIPAVVQDSTPTTNTAQIITSDQADPDSTVNNNAGAEDDQDAVTVTPQTADLQLQKTVDTPNPNVGANVTFTLRLSNTRGDTATNVLVTDLLPTGMTFVDAQPAGAYDALTGVWNVGSLRVGDNTELQIIALVENPGSKTNTATVTASDQFDPDSTPGGGNANEDDTASVSINPKSANLTLTKTVDNTTPNVNEDVTFLVTVTNNGPDSADGVVVEDQIPAGFSLTNISPQAGTTFDPGNGRWVIGTLANGASATLRIIGSGAQVADITNTAQVLESLTDDTTSDPGNNDPTEDDQASVTISPQQVDLSLTKSISNAAPNRGEEITYTLMLTNDGPSTATGIQVRDTLPTGVTFRSTSGSGSYSTGSGIWFIDTLPAGATVTLNIIAVVNATGTITNTAQVTLVDQPDVDSTPANDDPGEDDQESIDFRTPEADLRVTKSVNDATPTRNVTFTVDVLNQGPDDATNVVISDPLPNGILFDSADTPVDSAYDFGTGLWTINSIPAGTRAVLTLRGEIIRPGLKTNTATVDSLTQFDPNPDNNASSVDVLPETIDLSVTAAVDNPTPQLGEQVILTFTVTNDGDNNATGVVLTPNIFSGYRVQRAVLDAGSYDLQNNVWNLGDLAVGQTESIQLLTQVNAFGIRPQGIEVTAADQLDEDSTPANGVVSEDDLQNVLVQAPRNLSKRLFLAR